MARRLLLALVLSACASTPAALPGLHATRGPPGRPCSACTSDERCDGGVCVATRLRAVALPVASETPTFDAAVGAREQQRVDLRRRIKASRIAVIVGAGVLATGAAILTGTLIAGAPRDRYEDGNDGFEFLYGGGHAGLVLDLHF